MSHKIQKLETLEGIGGILCHGGYDCLHVGHMRFFAWAKALRIDEPLTVTITADEFFPKHKGANRPAFPEAVRAEWLSYIEIIDNIAIVYEPTGVLAINTIRPLIYAKGAEAEGLINEEQQATEKNGGKTVFMAKKYVDGQFYSSSRILSGGYLRSRSTRPRGIGEGDVGVE